jgi:uncharacterized membrane protein (DUF485 family)
METETKDIKAWEIFLVYMFLTMLLVSSIVVLVVYFIPSLKVTESRNDRLTLGFEAGFVVCLALSAILTGLAMRKPKGKEDEEEAEGDEEVEDEEE